MHSDDKLTAFLELESRFVGAGVLKIKPSQNDRAIALETRQCRCDHSPRADDPGRADRVQAVE